MKLLLQGSQITPTLTKALKNVSDGLTSYSKTHSNLISLLILFGHVSIVPR
jgi:hypothetical protein